MTKKSTVRSQILSCLEKDCRDFVIYPYGDDGLLIKECLEEYFGITPIAIVDNVLCNYKNNIMSGKELRECWQDHWIVLLSVGTGNISRQILDELLQYVDRKRIIQVSEDIVSENDFKVDRFFLASPKNSENGKLKFRLLYNTVSTWNVYATFMDACQEDEQIDAQVIVDGTQDLYGQNGMVERLQSLGIKYRRIEGYSIEEDKPDVLILSHIFSNIRLGNPKIVRKNSGLIAIATISVIQYGNAAIAFQKLLEDHFGEYHPDYYFFDTMIYREFEKYHALTEKYIEMGNAKYDGIFYAYKNRENIRCSRYWRKLAKKEKIVTWILDHGIIKRLNDESLHVQKDLTFDIYGKIFFTYAKKHKDIGFVFRPHSSLIKELLEFGLWSSDDVSRFREWLYQSENIVYDDSDSYDEALAISDILVADAHCGVIASAWPLGVPTCVLYRNPVSIDNEPKLTQYYYRVDQPQQLVSFLDRMTKDNYTDFQQSRDNIHEFVKHFDGKNGARIKNFLKERALHNNGH